MNGDSSVRLRDGRYRSRELGYRKGPEISLLHTVQHRGPCSILGNAYAVLFPRR
jgi:hypothetical protein